MSGCLRYGIRLQSDAPVLSRALDVMRTWTEAPPLRTAAPLCLVACHRPWPHCLPCLQVAMLFLTKGELRHEAMWRKWFERAEGLLPTQAVSNALCSGDAHLPQVMEACGNTLGAGEQQQRRQQHDWSGAAGSGSFGGRGASTLGAGSGWRPGRRQAARGADILARQHLFDVYVHPHPNFTGEGAPLGVRFCSLMCCCCAAAAVCVSRHPSLLRHAAA